MNLTEVDTDTLQLEESLQILQELIEYHPDLQPLTSHHIQRLKQFYSPYFDFEFSESGSYYYAAIKCMHSYYVDDSNRLLKISKRFSMSLQYLLEISMLTLDSSKNKSTVIDRLIDLGQLWDLVATSDMPTLIAQVLELMRLDLLNQH